MDRPIAADPMQGARATIGVAISAAGVACAITILYLAMRAVMQIGGACAEGGPFVPIRPCPKGVPVLMMGSIWGGIIFVAIYVWQTMKRGIPSFVAFAWPALFLSLGYNFLDFGLNPPGQEGAEWGWLICAIVFGLMGGIPLLAIMSPKVRRIGPSSHPRDVLALLPLAARGAGLARKMGTKLNVEDLRKVTDAWDASGIGDVESADSMVAALERLDRLRRSGAITEEEFIAAKRRLLKEDR